MTESSSVMVDTVKGFCRPEYEEVAHRFRQNFAERDELGASVCVIVDGDIVVDLHGGFSDPGLQRPWEADTMVVVFSCTKGAVALLCHMLERAGDLDFDRPVRAYWPGFAADGTAEITTRMVLNHQAGVPGLVEPVHGRDIYDAGLMAERVAREVPLWRPGTRHGYHALTAGWILAEVIGRITDRSVGQLFRDLVAEPLGLDFFIGLPEADEHRVATTVFPPGEDGLGGAFAEALARGMVIQTRAANSFAAYLSPGRCDAPGAHQAEVPAAGGIGNARALAGLYAPLSLDGSWRGTRLVGDRELAQMGAVESAAALDSVTFEPTRFSAGFEKSSYGRESLTGAPGTLRYSEAAFGHSGLGGSLGFADPDARLAFGYTPNRHVTPKTGGNARFQALVDATYQSLGYCDCSSGRWRRT